MFGIVAILTTVASQPASPMWPDTFWQTFDETTHYTIGSHKTNGTIYYDWTVKSYRIDRANGRYDRYCGLLSPYEFTNTPCSHYVVGGNRFLYYPQYNDCCFCCNSEHGCGMLFPGWMTNATYIDTEVHNGVMTYKWNKKGVQDNFIYETVGTVPVNRVTVSIYQAPDDDMEFGPRNLTLPTGILNLPSYCTISKNCESAACIGLRSGTEKQYPTS